MGPIKVTWPVGGYRHGLGCWRPWGPLTFLFHSASCSATWVALGVAGASEVSARGHGPDGVRWNFHRSVAYGFILAKTESGVTGTLNARLLRL